MKNDSAMEERIFAILSHIAESKNIKIDWEHLIVGYNGFWRIKNGESHIILGKHLRTNTEKRNFVFAHELGHAVLHKNNFDNALYWFNNRQNDYAVQKEAEANAFGKALIIGSLMGLVYGPDIRVGKNKSL